MGLAWAGLTGQRGTKVDKQKQGKGASPEGARAELNERMASIVGRLESEAQRRVDRRAPVEDRWLQDLRQYHGIYDDEVIARIKENEGSEVYVNLTASKCDALTARLIDLLFPTDDRNWGIEPTPVPELQSGQDDALAALDEAKEKVEAARAQAEGFKEAGDEEGAQAAQERMRQHEAQESEAQDAADRLAAIMDEARKRGELMEREIEDQLVEGHYQAEARDIIDDGCKIGMGVLKGPVLSHKIHRRWRRIAAPAEGQAEGQAEAEGSNNRPGWELIEVRKNAPGAYRIDPWSFFPDPDRRRPEDMEGFLERHLLNKKQLRELAQSDEMDNDVIRDLLREGAGQGTAPSYLANLHQITGQSNYDMKDMFVVWEYTGPIEPEEIETLNEAFHIESDGEEVDPLQDFQARVWFCNGRVISFAPHPLDSGEPLYSIFTIRADEASPFGFGVPAIMRHPQSILNGATRMMMDNSGLSTGPQIVLNKGQVVPQDGNWTLKPRKVWLRTSTTLAAGQVPFETYDIPSNQQELANIVQIAEAMIDNVTAQPAIAQGEQGTGITKTAQGMALLMQSANVVFRRIVRNFDDDVTTPLIRRFYDWNMQFSEKDEIKGDYSVKARGSGVLLVREMQAQNLMMIADRFGAHPIYGPMLKHVDLLHQIFRAHMIPADSVAKTEREYTQLMAEQQSQVSPADQLAAAQAEAAKMNAEATMADIDARVAIAEMDRETRLAVADRQHETAMMKLAETMNMKADELDALLAKHREDRDSKERIVAVEAALKRETGDSAGGYV